METNTSERRRSDDYKILREENNEGAKVAVQERDESSIADSESVK